MKTNNLVQHVLVQLLNPGMYNENILSAVLKEIKPSDIPALLQQRFNFQNLKPAVLPIQSEWRDKEFSDFFRDFSIKHHLELSNGTIYDINLYNLAHIVNSSKNKVAKEVSDTILNFLEENIKKIPALAKEKKELSYVFIRNKNCGINIGITPKDFYAKNLAPDYLSEFDSFAIQTLTSDLSINIYDTTNNKKFKTTFLNLIEKNPERLDDAVSLFNIASKNQVLYLIDQKDLAPKIFRNKELQKSFMTFFTDNGAANHKLLTKYLNTINQEYSSEEMLSFINTLIDKTTENVIFAQRNTHSMQTPLELNLTALTNLLQTKNKELFTSKTPSTKPSKAEIKESILKTNFCYISFGMLKPIEDKNNKPEEWIEFIKAYQNVVKDKGASSILARLHIQSNKNYLVEGIQKFLKSPRLTLDLIKKNETVFLKLLFMDTKIKKDVIAALLEKGYYFNPTFTISNKTYHLAGLKLSKENLIKNEKNLLGQTLDLGENKKSIKFKL